ncbi:DUF4159 domain-containing protein [Rhizobiales bacterium]|uniref:DUF4159 domain-containing protein n=1 Tax=Hongsoonwoonella zoysiae TaxID=2821844 RepID=UPI00155FFA3A|nr:DUF4159 domain-containing protein [Hongsoonwoonella zoysiae]NRG17603.1 DUF4159 domain-containing protein [Hongsoonwoonella zoysiae]
MPLGFTAPFVLSALILLPVIWWLLRLTPPRPRQVAFPPTRLLLEIEKREETPEKSPWWLTLLRLLLAAALIFALAGPVWKPAADVVPKDGPLWLIMDNGWSSAKSWEAQSELAARLIETAGTQGTAVLLAATADGANQPLVPDAAGVAGERLRAFEPRAWPTDRASLSTTLRAAATQQPPGAVIWLTDDLSDQSSEAFVRDLGTMSGDAPITVYGGLDLPTALAGARNDADALTTTVLLRDAAVGSEIVDIRALDLKGRVLSQTQALFDPGTTESEARFELPVELRNDVARIEIASEQSAAGTQLLDDRWRRRTVGLIAGTSSDLAQPLLSPLYYLRRALEPFAELRIPREGDLAKAIPELIDAGVSVLVLADVGRLPATAEETLADWTENGGTLLRFAGPRMAGGTDELIPTRLRTGDRTLGGSLSWEEPQTLAAFGAGSPLAGLDVPSDVTVNRQVLAEPSPDLSERTWAVLADGTPLVTAAGRGNGRVVLFHVTADTNWSNLPLSGSFVEMLRRIIATSDVARAGNTAQGAAAETASTSPMLPPLRLLDGYGRLTQPGNDALPIAADEIGDAAPSKKHPPGLYGADDAFRALNLLDNGDKLEPLDLSPLEARMERLAYPTAGPTDLMPLFLLVALALLLADAIAMLALRGEYDRIRQVMSGRTAALLIAGAVALSASTDLRAQESSDDLFALDASLDTRLAYVVTGDVEVDAASQAGLYGLSRYLTQRTALEPEAPIGIDITRDELAFFPLLYWPVTTAMQAPSSETMARIDAYMRNGGTILFDTRDQLNAGLQTFGTTENGAHLRRMLEDLDLPPLEPVPPDHVLTKAFYLLDFFPGRYAGSPLWVEAIEQGDQTGGRPVVAGDGVSPIMITGNDFAGAWATDETGSYLYPTVPADPLQREYAYRTGVNIVMYALTGNYKADQVHIPALLERLGQ